ncbi:MAG: hypothetical protein MJ101_02735 [Clostridia bacterium]|nr:hypothetical protein [Clostridia bacterium]
MTTDITPVPTDNTAVRDADDKKRALYDSQKKLLDTFLRHGAITEAQYNKSLGDLTVKMGMAGDKNG